MHDVVIDILVGRTLPVAILATHIREVRRGVQIHKSGRLARADAVAGQTTLARGQRNVGDGVIGSGVRRLIPLQIFVAMATGATTDADVAVGRREPPEEGVVARQIGQRHTIGVGRRRDGGETRPTGRADRGGGQYPVRTGRTVPTQGGVGFGFGEAGHPRLGINPTGRGDWKIHFRLRSRRQVACQGDRNAHRLIAENKSVRRFHNISTLQRT